MRKKLRSITSSKGPAVLAVAAILGIWRLVCMQGLVPEYLLPSPQDVLQAFWQERQALWENAVISLQEACYGLFFGALLGFLVSAVMNAVPVLKKALYPLLVVTQTIPTVAIAPLLVLWFGYEMTSKIVLIVLTTFFPMAVALLEGFSSADEDAVGLLRSMGAGKWQIFRYIRWPSALPQFFSGLKIAAAYSVVGAVISEWLGGFGGLGVYMTRVKKAFAFDKMFAVIFLISAVSLLLIAAVHGLERVCMPYRKTERMK